ncbi:DUF4232 domain-containing protein [Amycolatopsis taiwanensis]|uniref:DUF4232 domain-containing protein n=1 Tax=Amycolatopsis taiwanensis TaxID=342230 RepID=A0A9W6QY05_9PSEU|nr:DUF4232 domain-containing protein [Amycolatopsis taiwanensis]GLY64045.1 hypothetical protein Atai01_06640 [Amycolatopsis taiwanensis]
MVQNRISRIGLAVAAAAVAAVASACNQGTNNAQAPASETPATSVTAPSSSATDSPTPSAMPGASGGDAAANPAPDANGFCKSADLRLSLGRGEGAAGTAYRPLVFTNVSDHQCVIQGFPGVSYVGGDDGHQVGAAAERQGTKGAPITLHKGESAFATVGFVTIENFDPAACQPQPVRGLRVYPPQETASMYLDLPTTGCASDKIPGHQLSVKTIEKGTGEN